MDLLPRGDPRWSRYSNQGDCPRNCVPLWVLLDPLVHGYSRAERTLIAEGVAEHPSVSPYIISSGGMLYVEFSGDTRVSFRRRVRGFRRKVLGGILGEEITGGLPSDIRRKYGFDVA